MRSKGALAAECSDLRRVYSSRGLIGKRQETVALDGVTLEIPGRSVFGLLGPNGAGKTTTVRILSTLLTPTSGAARVMGFDVVREAAQVRKHIGLILGGERGLFGRLTGRENLQYYAAINHMSPSEANKRADSLLKLVGLKERGNSLVEQYSRGMKQRLHIARGLLTDPGVIFMDEPTTGLDPESARELRQLIPELVAQGKTVLLTTHYMFEADLLCQRIAIINRGRLVALGTPSEIKGQFSKVRVLEVQVAQLEPARLKDLRSVEGVQRVDVSVDGGMQRLTIQVGLHADARDKLGHILGDAGDQLVEREPTLEEAYLSILR
jgi:ABC-2 type transport system ATP-binding protein